MSNAIPALLPRLRLGDPVTDGGLTLIPVFGRFDGINHEDEAQTARDGKPHRHGNSKDIF